MKLTIIPIDNSVYKDGVSYVGLDLSSIPVDVHALQFNDNSNTGWIEFTSPIPNEEITSLPTWAITAMAKWDEAEAAEQAAKLAAEQADQQTE